MKTKKQLTAVGAYIYAGGFTLGIKRAGFDVLAHLEDPRPYAAKTSQLNLPEVRILPHPWDLAGLGRVDLVYANPPCKAFSSIGPMVRGKDGGANGRDAWLGNGALACTENVVGLLDTLAPQVLAWESVMGALNWASSFVGRLARQAMERGYHFSIVPHNAYHHGSIQDRRRVMFICSRAHPHLVDPDYRRTETVAQRLARVRGAAYDGTSDGDVRREGWLLEHQLPGESLRRTWERMTPEKKRRLGHLGQTIGRPGMAKGKKLRADGRCNVVLAVPFVHHEERRFLSIREMAALADFPASWKWAPKNACAFGEMSRGVSPKVGEWLGETARATIEAGDGVGGEPRLFFCDLRQEPDRRDDLWTYCRKFEINPVNFGLLPLNGDSGS